MRLTWCTNCETATPTLEVRMFVHHVLGTSKTSRNYLSTGSIRSMNIVLCE